MNALACVIVVAGAMSTAAAASAVQTGEDVMKQAAAMPVPATGIAAAVDDSIAGDGEAQRMVALGYVRLGSVARGDQMIAYRRGQQGPLVTLPAAKGELRCWVMARPADGRTVVVDAVGAKLGIPDRGSAGATGWQVAGYSLSFDWFDDSGKLPFTRVEIYKFPQEKK